MANSNEREAMRARGAYRILLAAAALIILLLAQAAPAYVVGIGDFGPSTETDYSFNHLLNGWLVGPATVTPDPNSGAWVKELNAPSWWPRRTNTFNLIEVLKVGDGPSWTGWHEEILGETKWNWADGCLFTYNSSAPPAGLLGMFKNIDLVAEGKITDSRIDFDLAATPLAADTWVLIWKTIAWTGGTWKGGFNGPGNLFVRETLTTTTATPLPGAVWMLAAGFVGLVGIRRKVFKESLITG